MDDLHGTAAASAREYGTWFEVRGGGEVDLEQQVQQLDQLLAVGMQEAKIARPPEAPMASAQGGHPVSVSMIVRQAAGMGFHQPFPAGKIGIGLAGFEDDHHRADALARLPFGITERLNHQKKEVTHMRKPDVDAIADAIMRPDLEARQELERKRIKAAWRQSEQRKAAWLALVGMALGAAITLSAGESFAADAWRGAIAGLAMGGLWIGVRRLRGAK